MCTHNKQFVWYCSKWEGLLRICCKQAELRPDLSYNSSRNRSRPTLPSNPPHTRAWGEQWAAGHSPQLLSVWKRERESLGFRQNLSEKHWDWWGERAHRSIFEYESFKHKVLGKSKSMWSYCQRGAQALGLPLPFTPSLRYTPPPPLYHSSRPAIPRVKEIQLDGLYPNYYWLISVVRRFAGGKI